MKWIPQKHPKDQGKHELFLGKYKKVDKLLARLIRQRESYLIKSGMKSVMSQKTLHKF